MGFGGRDGASAWRTLSFLHRRLGVIQSKNNRARGWAVWGIAVGLSCCSYKKQYAFWKGIRLGFCSASVASNCLSWNKQCLPFLLPKQAEERNGVEGKEGFPGGS